MTNMQHYMEDIQDILEGFHTEIDKRFKRIGKWDQQIAEWSEESKALENYVFDDTKSDSKREAKAVRLGELRLEIRSLTEKKLSLCQKNQNTLQAIYKKVSEIAYHCKCEVEIDNPGCTENREQLFCRTIGYAQLEADHADGTIQISSSANIASGSGRRTREMSMMTDDDETRSSTPAPKEGKRRGVGRPRAVLKDSSQNSKGSTVSNSARSSLERDLGGRKSEKISTYMRKKREKQLELQRIDEEDRRNKIIRREVKKEVADMIGDEFAGWASDNNMGTAIGDGAACLDDEEQELLDLLSIDGHLPSPPREIMQTLDMSDSGMFASNMFHSDSESSLVMYPPSRHQQQKVKFTDFDPNASSSRTTKRGMSGDLDLGANGDEKRKRNALYASIADTSFSGRPRKLTDRANEMLQKTREREERRRMKHENDDWCVCDGNVNSLTMVECDNGNCKVEWYHVECVGFTGSPGDPWYCPTCQRIPPYMRTVKSSSD